MWRISKNKDDGFTTEDLLNVVKPLIPNYIEEFYKTHPFNFDMSKFIRFYNPDYYVNVVQINENTYQDIAGMLYRTDGTTYAVDYMATELYVWDYIKLPDGTIIEVNENKTINAPNAIVIEYITGYSGNTIVATPKAEIYNFNSHTHAIQTITTTAQTLTFNAANGVADLPEVPKNIKNLYLNNCPYVPLLKDSQIENVICNVDTPITLNETFQNCKNIKSLENVVCTGHVKSKWSDNSNACNLVEYNNLQYIDDYGFYNCKFTKSDNRTITFNNLLSVGAYGLYYTENLHIETGDELQKATISDTYGIARCKNCVFNFKGNTSNDNNYHHMTDCCFIISNIDGCRCSYCSLCYIEFANMAVIDKQIIQDCSNCVINFKEVSLCNYPIALSSNNIIIIAPELRDAASAFYNSFTLSYNIMIYCNLTLTKGMAHSEAVSFGLLKTYEQRTAWQRYCGPCIYTDTTFNITTMGPSVFHKTIDLPADDYYIGMSFCKVNNTRGTNELLCLLCQDVELYDPNNLLSDNSFQHSNFCRITH